MLDGTSSLPFPGRIKCKASCLAAGIRCCYITGSSGGDYLFVSRRSSTQACNWCRRVVIKLSLRILPGVKTGGKRADTALRKGQARLAPLPGRGLSMPARQWDHPLHNLNMPVWSHPCLDGRRNKSSAGDAMSAAERAVAFV